MSHIDDLIKKYAPDGVAFEPMGRIFNMKAGKNIRAAAISPLRDDAHPFPCYGGNGIRGYVADYSHDGQYLLIGRQGALSGNVKRTAGKFYATEHAVVTQPRSQASIDIDWAYHLLTVMNLNQYVSQGAQPGLAVSTLAKVMIPVPPIELQRELAKLLDSFQALAASLGAELDAELKARRLQYAHYRESLLTAGGSKTNIVPMGELGELIRGRRFVKTDIVDKGIPAIHYGEIYTHYGTSTSEVVSNVREDLAGQLRYAKPGDVVIAAVGETVEDVGKAVAWLGDEPVAIHDDTFLFRSELNPKYVSYFMQTADFHGQKNKHVARAKMKRLSGESLAKIAIPVPPLDLQERIVAILDQLETLVNDLSVSLPAERLARRKQYEYYRDKLLTFKELAI
ncbi:restriction endonuclease subunit S [Microbispora hainanensis]|uniref:restriction endonuclease subunit S n=1 Tax=Microbispora hainanensis TaxID=568844 RepID=UPI0033C882D9